MCCSPWYRYENDSLANHIETIIDFIKDYKDAKADLDREFYITVFNQYLVSACHPKMHRRIRHWSSIHFLTTLEEVDIRLVPAALDLTYGERRDQGLSAYLLTVWTTYLARLEGHKQVLGCKTKLGSLLHSVPDMRFPALKHALDMFSCKSLVKAVVNRPVILEFHTFFLILLHEFKLGLHQIVKSRNTRSMMEHKYDVWFYGSILFNVVYSKTYLCYMHVLASTPGPGLQVTRLTLGDIIARRRASGVNPRGKRGLKKQAVLAAAATANTVPDAGMAGGSAGINVSRATIVSGGVGPHTTAADARTNSNSSADNASVVDSTTEYHTAFDGTTHTGSTPSDDASTDDASDEYVSADDASVNGTGLDFETSAFDDQTDQDLVQLAMNELDEPIVDIYRKWARALVAHPAAAHLLGANAKYSNDEVNNDFVIHLIDVDHPNPAYAQPAGGEQESEMQAPAKEPQSNSEIPVNGRRVLDGKAVAEPFPLPQQEDLRSDTAVGHAAGEASEPMAEAARAAQEKVWVDLLLSLGGPTPLVANYSNREVVEQVRKCIEKATTSNSHEACVKLNKLGLAGFFGNFHCETLLAMLSAEPWCRDFAAGHDAHDKAALNDALEVFPLPHTVFAHLMSDL